MQIEHKIIYYNSVKEEKYRLFQLRQVKFIKNLTLERCFTKKSFLNMGKLIKRTLARVKVAQKLSLGHQVMPPELNELLIRKLHFDIYHKFSQYLTSYRGVSNLPVLKHMKMMKKLTLSWDKTKAIVPNYLKKLDTLEITIKTAEAVLDEHNLIKLHRMSELKDVKLVGGTCKIWRLFAMMKKIKMQAQPNFYITFCKIDCEPSQIFKFVQKQSWPWFNHKSMEYMNNWPESLLPLLLNSPDLMGPLEHFGYFDVMEPRADSIRACPFHIFQKFENMTSLALNFYEQVDRKILEDFFVQLCFPRNLESFKLVIYLKDFNANRCCIGHYYKEFSKLRKLKQLFIMANFQGIPKFETVDRLWKHYLEIMNNIDSQNPLESLTLGLQPAKENNIIYDIAFDQTLLPVLAKFDTLRDLKLSFYLSKMSWTSTLESQNKVSLPALENFTLFAADMDVRILRFLRVCAPAIVWLSIDLYAPLQFTKIIEVCKATQSFRGLEACHIEPHCYSIKDGSKDPEYYQIILVREILLLYIALSKLRKACFCFPNEEINKKHLEFIAQSFQYNKRIECAKVETKGWTILTDSQNPGKYRLQYPEPMNPMMNLYG